MKTTLTQKLTTAAEAENYIETLHKTNRLYHLDDSAADIIILATGDSLFSPDEATLADQRRDECFELLEDPHSFCLGLISKNK